MYLNDQPTRKVEVEIEMVRLIIEKKQHDTGKRILSKYPFVLKKLELR